MITTKFAGSIRWLVPMPEFDGSQSCASVGDMFYPPEDVSASAAMLQNNAAKRVCKECPFLNDCLNYALAHEMHGVWGGTSPQQRDEMRRKLKMNCTPPDEIHRIFYTPRFNGRVVKATHYNKEIDNGLTHMDDLVSFDVLRHPLDSDATDVHIA